MSTGSLNTSPRLNQLNLSLKIIVSVVLSLSTLHCANRKTYPMKQAPTSEKELGLIVKTTSDQLDTLVANNPSVDVRTLSVQNGIYELNNISFEQAQEISSRPVYKNIFIQTVQKNNLQMNPFTRIAKNTSPDAEMALNSCLETAQSPKITVNTNINEQTATLTLGENILLTANATAHPLVGGKVRILWDILPPEFSSLKITQGITKEQKITPDAVGYYRFLAVAQGADLSCSFTIVHLLVTANPEISNTIPNIQKAKDLSPFSFLKDVNAVAAWKLSLGKNITVAVLDSGVHYNHVGIRKNIKINRREKLDSKDSDNNGFIDDTIGWDFYNNDRFPFDDLGHGTHVAGLIASPYMGIAPQAKILPVKVLNAAGSSDLATIVAGIYYAADSGARIINASLGFDSLPEIPQPLLDAIEDIQSKNIIFVAAAGNGDQSGIGFDIKKRPVYPASFALDNLISVAATAQNEITSYSNFNNELVHLAAPGGNPQQLMMSLTTLNPNNFPLIGQFGTSMASPVVTGIAALMLSASTTPMDIKRIRQILMETGTELPTLKDKVISNKQVDAQKAVQAVLDLKPATSIL